MKKYLSLFLLICILVLSVSCNDVANNPDESTDAATDAINESTTATIVTDNVTTDAVTEAPQAAKQTFKVGYSRVDITPDGPVYLDETSILRDALSHIYATCVAVNDGNKTVLMYTIDAKNIGPEEIVQLRVKIAAATKVPSQNITLSTTHNHSVPKIGDPTVKTENAKWTAKVNDALIQAGKEAIADLSDAKIYTATGKTTGMAFVRRYLLADGTYTGIHNGNKSTAEIVGYETEADDTVQVIRFVRDDKKDVLVANWQAHVATAITVNPGSITADLVGFARDKAESLDDDVLFALYIGASGNINLTAKVPGTKKYNSYVDVGNALGEVIIDACKQMQEVNTGKIKVSYKNVKVAVRKDDEETVKKAKEVNSYPEGSGSYKILLEKYGFSSKYEVSAIIKRANSKETEDLYISAFSFGDIGFVSVPYEMFDTNGMQLKEGSPLKMTFILTNANGWAAYIPSADAVPHGGYEVYHSQYVFGTGENIINELLTMLKSQVKK